ncbi:UNVERIFIED_CONTAM: hypothetical protein RMT77_018253 [Armadillidium vulgare]
MNIKCENEIKIEELDLEYDSYQQDSQIFCDNESDFTLKTEDIEIEELYENISIKSELTELEKESVLDKGLVNTGVIKSENVMMIEEKSCGQHSKSFPHIESIIPLPESIKRELDENSSFIKSEPRESDLEFVFNEEKVENNGIKTENSPMKKFDLHHNFVDVSCLEPRGGSVTVKSVSRKGDEVSRNERKKYRKKGLKNQRCKYCNIDFKSKAEFKTHLKSQCKTKLKCSHCNYECNYKYDMKRHLLIHSDKKLFKCSECTYECNYKESMKSHMLTHNSIKLFICS